MAMTLVKLKLSMQLSLHLAFSIEPFPTVFQGFDVLFTFGFREPLLFQFLFLQKYLTLSLLCSFSAIFSFVTQSLSLALKRSSCFYICCFQNCRCRDGRRTEAKTLFVVPFVAFRSCSLFLHSRPTHSPFHSLSSDPTVRGWHIPVREVILVYTGSIPSTRKN